MKDEEKIYMAADAAWEKCHQREYATDNLQGVAKGFFRAGFNAAIDHLLSLPWNEAFALFGYEDKTKDEEPNDFFKDFSPLEESTL